MKLSSPLLLALAMAVCAPGPASAAPAKGKQKTSAASAKKTTTGGKRAKAPQAKAKPKRAAPKIDYAGEQVNFTDWKAISDFADELALRQGFPREELKLLFNQVRYVDSAVQLVKPAPPGKPKNMAAVRELLIEPVRIGAGVKFWTDNADLLAKAEREYGVPAEIIVGIIGIETVYGRNTGRFRVLDVLTTLAFAYPDAPNQAARMAFFRGELENTLLLARKNSIDPFSLLGSFAGAIGLPQFMPGSVLAYGVDYDNDGAVNLRGSSADAIGSVANFLVQHGWLREQNGPLVYQATVSPGLGWQRFIGAGLSAKFPLAEISAAGVAASVQPPAERLYGLIDLQNGAQATEYWIATNNFFAITQYNRSYFYAMSVLELGRAVKLGLGTAPVVPVPIL